MSIAVLPPLDEPPQAPVFRFTIEEYHRLIEAEILTEEDRVELLEGWIVHKRGHHPPHSVAIGLASAVVRRLLPPGWHERVQLPITLADSEPEPDVAIVRGGLRDYLERHPGAAETGLLIEVSDSTLQIDRSTTARVYARAGIPRFWIVNLVDRQIETFADPVLSPAAPSYREVQVLSPGQQVPLLLDGDEIARIAVDDLLP